VRDEAIAGFHALGPNYTPSPTFSTVDTAYLHQVLTASLSHATRLALLFAAGMLLIGFLLSLLIPRLSPPRRTGAAELFETFEALEALDPLDADPGYLGRPEIEDPAPSRLAAAGPPIPDTRPPDPAAG
jgi:hypothetical protein